MDMRSLFGGLPRGRPPTCLPHPGVPLKCESLKGGGGAPSAELANDIYAMGGTTLVPDSIDLGAAGFDAFSHDEQAARIPQHVLAAHKMALQSFTSAEAAAAISAARGGPCPQAHICLAKESSSLDDALERYKKATGEAELLIDLFAPLYLMGARVEAVGLASRPEINGRTGLVISFVPSKGRYGVRFGSEDLLLKPQNLNADSINVPAAKRLASYSPDESLWDCRLARPWFRAVLGFANTFRKLGKFEEALEIYNVLEDVDGKHFVTQSSHFVQWRNYIASCFLLLGRPLEARRYLVLTSQSVIEYTFIYASSSLFFSLNLALAEYLIALEDGTRLQDPPGPVPLEAADGNVLNLKEQPELIWWRLSTSGPEGLHTFTAVYEYLFDDSRKLPDLFSIPETMGESAGHGQALAYLSGGMLELWRSTPGAIRMLRRQRNFFHSRALLTGEGIEKNVDMLQRYLTDIAGLPGNGDAVEMLVREAAWYEPAAQRVRVLGLVLSAVRHDYPSAKEDSFVPTRETVLGQCMYFDAQPQVVRMLIEAGAPCWWPNDQEWRPSPLLMAVEQGSWKPLMVALALRPELRSDEILSRLADAVWTTSCAMCMAGALDHRCPRCANKAPGDAPDFAHSPTASFEMIIDVLVYYGLRAPPEPPENVVRAAAERMSSRAVCAGKLNERFRGRVASALGPDAATPNRCVGCDRAPASECRKCRKCLQAVYCSNACQEQHWEAHKVACGPRAAERMRKRIVEALADVGLAGPDVPRELDVD